MRQYTNNAGLTQCTQHLPTVAGAGYSVYGSVQCTVYSVQIRVESFTRLSIGAIYTPEKWARFAIEKFNVFDAWISGKTVFDPTMGDGSLLSALAAYGLSQGYTPSQLPWEKLFGLELNAESYEKALAYFSTRYGIDMCGNFYNADIFDFKGRTFDVLFGNPPWCNFVDLPQNYKEYIKPFFHKYGLIDNSKKLLLGGSRIDIAALVIQKTISDNLRENGEAVFFLPLSLFLNDGAHTAFRKFKARNERYALYSIYDFENTHAFDKIATRYGLAHFMKTGEKSDVVPFFRFEDDAWKEYKAISPEAGKPYYIASAATPVLDIPRIEVPLSAKPRQGINPCGAINVFVFKEYESIDDNFCKVNKDYYLPQKYVYPLITAQNFAGDAAPAKWVLLPYNSTTGKPLALGELQEEPALAEYLQKNKETLENRKGTLIRAYIKRGIWWAMLGVGPYSFANYKIVWEAYGKNTFRPQLFTGNWQANQSLQAFIPCATKEDAKGLLSLLSDPKIEEYLRSSGMGGTMNWAQPGRVASLLYYS